MKPSAAPPTADVLAAKAAALTKSPGPQKREIAGDALLAAIRAGSPLKKVGPPVEKKDISPVTGYNASLAEQVRNLDSSSSSSSSDDADWGDDSPTETKVTSSTTSSFTPQEAYSAFSDKLDAAKRLPSSPAIVQEFNKLVAALRTVKQGVSDITKVRTAGNSPALWRGEMEGDLLVLQGSRNMKQFSQELLEEINRIESTASRAASTEGSAVSAAKRAVEVIRGEPKNTATQKALATAEGELKKAEEELKWANAEWRKWQEAKWELESTVRSLDSEIETTGQDLLLKLKTVVTDASILRDETSSEYQLFDMIRKLQGLRKSPVLRKEIREFEDTYGLLPVNSMEAYLGFSDELDAAMAQTSSLNKVGDFNKLIASLEIVRQMGKSATAARIAAGNSNPALREEELRGELLLITGSKNLKLFSANLLEEINSKFGERDPKTENIARAAATVINYNWPLNDKDLFNAKEELIKKISALDAVIETMAHGAFDKLNSLSADSATLQKTDSDEYLLFDMLKKLQGVFRNSSVLKEDLEGFVTKYNPAVKVEPAADLAQILQQMRTSLERNDDKKSNDDEESWSSSSSSEEEDSDDWPEVVFVPTVTTTVPADSGKDKDPVKIEGKEGSIVDEIAEGFSKSWNSFSSSLSGFFGSGKPVGGSAAKDTESGAKKPSAKMTSTNQQLPVKGDSGKDREDKK